MSRTTQKSLTLVFVVAIFTLAAVTPAQGETVLRWKFTPGDAFQLVMQGNTTVKTSTGDTPVTMTATYVAEMSQVIESVDANGVASVTQTINRLRQKMSSPQGVVMDYDSAAAADINGKSRLLVPLFDAIVNKPISLKADPRGRISDAQVPQSVIDAANEMPGLGGLFSGKTMGQFSGLGTLPKEAVSIGDIWTNEEDITVPKLGKMKVKSTFRYLGSEVRDGMTLEKIGYTQEQMLAGSATEKPDHGAKMTDASASGTMYFDNVAGRFVEGTIKSKMKMEVTVVGMTLKTDMAMDMQMKLDLADASDKPAPLPQ